MKFNRKYELLIGDPYKIDASQISLAPFLTPEAKLNALEDGIRKANEEKSGYKISDSHIEFTIEKTKSGQSPNTASIKVANLSDEVVSYLENRTGKKTVILLKCGYEGEPLKTITLANLERYTDRFSKETRWTELFLAEGGANFQETFTSRYYPSGTSVDSIVSDLISDLKLPRSGAFVYKGGETTDKDFYFSGNVYDQLHRLSVFYDYNFSVQDGVCFWMPIGVGLKKNVVLLSPDTGLIGDVAPLDATPGISQNNTKELNPGIKFTSLLDGALHPEATVKIESRNKTGAYKINKVIHKGSYEGTAWFTECEAEQVEIV